MPPGTGKAPIAPAEPSAHTGRKPSWYAARQLSKPSPIVRPCSTFSSASILIAAPCDRPHHHAADLLALQRQRRSLDCHQFVIRDGAEGRDHARLADARAERTIRVVSNDSACDIVGELEPAPAKICFDDGAARIAGFFPQRQRIAGAAAMRLVASLGSLRSSSRRNSRIATISLFPVGLSSFPAANGHDPGRCANRRSRSCSPQSRRALRWTG